MGELVNGIYEGNPHVGLPITDDDAKIEAMLADVSIPFALHNANKRSVVLDPDSSADRRQLIELAAGADIVGMDDLAARVKAGDMPFDVVIAAPDAMRVVGTLGQILGPRGLMPNPKVGTVTPNVAQAVKDAKSGSVEFRVEKAGIIHAGVGKASFAEADIEKNLKSSV